MNPFLSCNLQPFPSYDAKDNSNNNYIDGNDTFYLTPSSHIDVANDQEIGEERRKENKGVTSLQEKDRPVGNIERRDIDKGGEEDELKGIIQSNHSQEKEREGNTSEGFMERGSHQNTSLDGSNSTMCASNENTSTVATSYNNNYREPATKIQATTASSERLQDQPQECNQHLNNGIRRDRNGKEKGNRQIRGEKKNIEENIIEAPVVFQCANCLYIVGDSLSMASADEDLGTVSLLGAVGVSRSKKLKTSEYGKDLGATYHEMHCEKCRVKLGRIYITTPVILDSLRNMFTFHSNALSSFELGTCDQVCNIEELAAVDVSDGTMAMVCYDASNLPYTSNHEQSRREADGSADDSNLNTNDASTTNGEDISAIQKELSKIQNLMVVFHDRISFLESSLRQQGKDTDVNYNCNNDGAYTSVPVNNHNIYHHTNNNNSFPRCTSIESIPSDRHREESFQGNGHHSSNINRGSYRSNCNKGNDNNNSSSNNNSCINSMNGMSGMNGVTSAAGIGSGIGIGMRIGMGGALPEQVQSSGKNFIFIQESNQNHLLGDRRQPHYQYTSLNNNNDSSRQGNLYDLNDDKHIENSNDLNDSNDSCNEGEVYGVHSVLTSPGTHQYDEVVTSKPRNKRKLPNKVKEWSRSKSLTSAKRVSSKPKVRISSRRKT